MIVATGIELRAGARLLIEDASFRIAAGDRIGLVGRNGAGKTTLTKILAGEGLPAAGTVTRTGAVGYLPQDPRTGDLEMLARDRILSARGLDDVVRRAARGRGRRWAATTTPIRDKAMRRYARARGRVRTPAAGTPPSPRPRRSRSSLGLEDRILGQPLQHPLRRPAPPRRAGPDPVLRRRDPAARRADQPPRRRLDRLAARLPQAPTRAG